MNKKWARKFDKCIGCERNDRKHKGNGLCMNCFDSKRAKTPNGRKNQENYRNKNRLKIRASQKRWHKENKIKLFSLLGGKCSKCLFNDERALQIDHINGGGIKERRTVNTKDFHRMVLKSIANKENKYQILCANCNWIKRHDNQEWGGAPKKHL